MGLFEQFPYQNFHELNLDWLIQQINMVKESVVLSVNGQTGEVILYPEAFVRLPDLSDTSTWSFYRYVNNKAEGVQFINGQPMQRIDDLNRYDIYDSGNPPPYPVTAVNGQTGDVVIAVPVQSVNGMTGNVILYQNASIEFPAINTDSWEMWRETDTNQALGVKFNAGQPMKRVDNGLEYTVYDSQNQPPYPVESVAGLTGAVAILNTQIVTDQGQQKVQIVFPVNSVDGQTGSVNTWAYTNNATTKIPLAAPADLWNLTRELNSGMVGLRFTYDSVNGSQAYLTFNDGVNPETVLRLLTPADIPSSSGVVSVNGLAGVVDLYADNIQMDSTNPTFVKDAIGANATAISNNTSDIAANTLNIAANTQAINQKQDKTLTEPAGYIIGVINDLNALYNGMSNGGYSICKFTANSAGAPFSGDGVVLTYKNSANYGCQVAYSDRGEYYRKITNGFGAWETNAFNSNLDFVTRSVSYAYNLAAGGNIATNLKTLIDADIPSGYRFFGLSGYTTNSINVVMISMRYNDSAYSLQIRNISQSQITENVEVFYICMKV